MKIDTKTLGTGTLDDDERQAVADSIGTCYLCQQVLYTVNPQGRGPRRAVQDGRDGGGDL